MWHLTWFAQAWGAGVWIYLRLWKDNLLQGGQATGSMEGSTPVHAATDLVNEKLTFCMHFPIPTNDLDALREVLQEWRIRPRLCRCGVGQCGHWAA